MTAIQNRVQHTGQSVNKKDSLHCTAPVLQQELSGSVASRSVGAIIKEAREDAGLSQYDLADRTNLSRSTIAAIETDVPGTVKLATILVIAEVLNINLATFAAKHSSEIEATLDEFLNNKLAGEVPPDERALLLTFGMSLAPRRAATVKTYMHALDAIRASSKKEK